ncbi:hypothetical protein GCM10009422_19490 [Brevundimonas kwangchunensis]|uniref:Carboxypeptidase regulatory-like domain-containing protein n=1 Tax=Brevundimonas kwangchunensis TaxID=322163 RepID=A0ABN1GYD5_9CAUL
MKRAIFAGMLLGASAALAACSDAPRSADKVDPASQATGWTQPPEITGVRRGPATLIFSGMAEPGARVVLRNDEGAAFAAAADERGAFEIRMTAPRAHLVLRPETQVGQDAAVSPDRLLILADGPIAVLRAGGPTRRLGDSPALGAVDSDGRAALASGQAAEGVARVAVAAGSELLQVTPDATGHWSVVLAGAGAAQSIRVGSTTFAWPGPGAGTDSLTAERAGEGWRVAWNGPAGARQWTWLPDV